MADETNLIHVPDPGHPRPESKRLHLHISMAGGWWWGGGGEDAGLQIETSLSAHPNTPPDTVPLPFILFDLPTCCGLWDV